MVEFETKWMKVLGSFDGEEYRDLQMEHGWKNLPTKRLPIETQKDIDKYKKEITLSSILVLNHPYHCTLDVNGKITSPMGQEAKTYLKSIERLLQRKDSARVSTVFFDSPEAYVFDFRKRLLNGQIQSVVLTDIASGGSLFGKARQEVGSNKTIYLGGSYLPCVSDTAQELYGIGNKVILIEDAILTALPKLAGCSKAKRVRGILDEMVIDEDKISFTTIAEFLREYGH